MATGKTPFWRYLLLMLGVLAGSTAVIMIKASTLPSAFVAAGRLLVAAAFLFPFFLRDLARLRARGEKWRPGRCILPGIVLAAHFLSWVWAARETMAPNASLIVNVAPAVMPLLMWLLIKEVLNKHEVLGTLIALTGVAILFGMDLHLAPDSFVGDAVCFGSMILFTLYLALARRHRRSTSLWLYIVPVYLLGGLICLGVSIPLIDPKELLAPKEILLVVGLGLVPTVIGHTIFNSSMRNMRGQVVAVANLCQFIFVWALSYPVLRELPTWGFYPASVLVVTGALIVIRYSPE
jgi:drug/metabolite transporter (DMT)-like permease